MIPAKALSIVNEDSASDTEHELHELASALRPRRVGPVLVTPSSSQPTTSHMNIMRGIGKRLRSPYEPECQGPLPNPDFCSPSENGSEVYERGGGGGEGLNDAAVGHGGGRYVSMLRLTKVRRAEDANKSSSSAVSVHPNTTAFLRADLNRLGESLARVEEQLERERGMIEKLEKSSSEFTGTIPGKLDAFRNEVFGRIAEVKQGQERLQKEVSSIQNDMCAVKENLVSIQGCATKLEGNVQQLMVALEKVTEQTNRMQPALGIASDGLVSSVKPLGEPATTIRDASSKPAFGSTSFSFAPAASTTPNNINLSYSTKPADATPFSYPSPQPQETGKSESSKPPSDLPTLPQAATERAANRNASQAFSNPFMKPSTISTPAADGAANAHSDTDAIDKHTAPGAFSVDPNSSKGAVLGTSGGMFNPFGGGGSFAGTPSTGTTTTAARPPTSSLFSGDKPQPPSEGSVNPAFSTAPTTANQSGAPTEPTAAPFSFGKAAFAGMTAPPATSHGKAPPGLFSFSSAENVTSGGGVTPAALPGFSLGTAAAPSSAVGAVPAPNGAFRGFGGPTPPGSVTAAPVATPSLFGSAFPSASQPKEAVRTPGDTASGAQEGQKSLGSGSVAFASPLPFTTAPAVPSSVSVPSFGFGASSANNATTAPPAASSPFVANVPSSTTIGGGVGNNARSTTSQYSFGGNSNTSVGGASPFGSTAVASTPFGAPAANPTGSGVGGGFTPAAPATAAPPFAAPINNTISFGSGSGSFMGSDGGASGSQILGTKKRRATNRRY